MLTLQPDATTTAARFDSEPAGLDLPLLEIAQHPFPHVLRQGFIKAELFNRLRDGFPACPPGSGPTGFSLYPTDPLFRQLMAGNSAWRSLWDAFRNSRFLAWARAQFVSEWAAAGCRIDLSRARLVDYEEDRIDKERSTLRRVEHAPEELWVRMDLYQGRVGYARRIHCDHARRLFTLLIYFSDHDEDGMTGGELLLHATPWRRWLHRPLVVTPRENLMVAFPCTDRSYHSVAPIITTQRPRNYLQVQISSSVDVWPRGCREGWPDGSP
jgi:hypothetical protein